MNTSVHMIMETCTADILQNLRLGVLKTAQISQGHFNFFLQGNADFVFATLQTW